MDRSLWKVAWLLVVVAAAGCGDASRHRSLATSTTSSGTSFDASTFDQATWE